MKSDENPVQIVCKVFVSKKEDVRQSCTCSSYGKVSNSHNNFSVLGRYLNFFDSAKISKFGCNKNTFILFIRSLFLLLSTEPKIQGENTEDVGSLENITVPKFHLHLLGKANHRRYGMVLECKVLRNFRDKGKLSKGDTRLYPSEMSTRVMND